jgi:hypothetical protein
MVLRAILALLADLLVCYLCGELVLYNFYRRICHPFSNILVGFLLGQSIFEVVTLGCYFLGKGLAEVTVLWLILAGVLCIAGGWTWIRHIRAAGHGPAAEMQKHSGHDPEAGAQQRAESPRLMWIAVAGAVATVLLFCYYVSVNGEFKADSRYYIPLVNTTLTTGTLFQYNPYNGIYGDAWFLRRALATYEIHSAMLCKVFQLHALVVTRITRACENVILTSMAVYLLGRKILWRMETNRGKAQIKSCCLVMVFLWFQQVYALTYPSSAMFFLTRAYEGKALIANALVLFTMYLCAEFLLRRQKRYLLLLGIALWGATAVSSTGTAVIGIEILLFAAACALKQIWERGRERKYVRG